MNKFITFWYDLGCKYDKNFDFSNGVDKIIESRKQMDPLHYALSIFCQHMCNMKQLRTLQIYDEYKKREKI